MNKRRILALVLACVLCVCIGIGGTLAWLTATTTPVTNTFTTSDINITLTETDADNDQNANANSYQMVPGYTITKDPKVTVLGGSEKCYLFVKLEKSSNFDSFMTYEMATDWTQLTGITGVTGVYYRVVDSSTDNQVFDVLKDNQVKVLDSVTKAQMNQVTTNPTLTVTAYASQYMKNNTESFTAAEAWANITNPTT